MRLRYKRGLRQITGDLTRVRHLSLATVRCDGAVQTVRIPDCGERRDVDLHLSRNTKSIEGRRKFIYLFPQRVKVG